MSTGENIFPDDASSGSNSRPSLTVRSTNPQIPSLSRSRTLSTSTFRTSSKSNEDKSVKKTQATTTSGSTECSSLDSDTRILLEKESEQCKSLEAQLEVIKERLSKKEIKEGSPQHNELLEIQQRLVHISQQIHTINNNHISLEEDVRQLKEQQASCCACCSLF